MLYGNRQSLEVPRSSSLHLSLPSSPGRSPADPHGLCEAQQGRKGASRSPVLQSLLHSSWVFLGMEMKCWASWHENCGDLLLPAAIHEPVQLRAASLALAQAEPSWEITGSCCRVRARPVSPSAATGAELEVSPAGQHLAVWSAQSCALGGLCSKAGAKQLCRCQYGKSGTLRKGTGTRGHCPPPSVTCHNVPCPCSGAAQLPEGTCPPWLHRDGAGSGQG